MKPINQFIKESEEEFEKLINKFNKYIQSYIYNGGKKEGEINYNKLKSHHLEKLKQAYALGRKEKKIKGWRRTKNFSTEAIYD